MRTKNESVTLERINIKLETSVKQWFSDKAATYGMPMGVYMQYILTQFYETQINNEAVRSLSNLNRDDELKETNKMLLELLTMFQELEEESDKALTENSKTGKSKSKK